VLAQLKFVFSALKAVYRQLVQPAELFTGNLHQFTYGKIKFTFCKMFV